MDNTSQKILYGTSITESSFIPTIYDPRILFRDKINGSFFYIDEPTLYKNLLLLGGAGSGKTNILNQIVEQVMDMNTSGARDGISLIFDTKCDYITHRNFRNPGDYVIGNDESYRDQSVTWNIFDEVLADGALPINYEANAREIASILFKDRGSKSQPFFCNAARDIFANTIIYFIRRYNEQPNTLGHILNNHELVQFILKNEPKDFKNYFNKYPDMHGLITYFGDGSSNQALGVFGELRSMIYDCFQGIFARKPSSSNPSFSIRQAIRKKGGKTIFILYDLSVGESMTPIYRLLVDLALKEALSTKSNGHTHIFLDELKLLPKITHLEDALNFGRSKKVSVVAGIQSVGQIYSLYGKETGQVILSGFGSNIALRTADFESRDYITKLYGTNYMTYRYINNNNSPIDHEREGNTVEQWHYRSLDKPGLGIVGLASQATPFFFNFEEDL